MRAISAYLNTPRRGDRQNPIPSLRPILGVAFGLAGLSVSHFCAAFRTEYGLPPHQFQLQIRIARAKELMSRGMPAAEVAVATGFSHQSHFGRHFKRLLGVSPSSFGPLKR